MVWIDDHDVGRLEIAMDDALGMSGLEDLAHLPQAAGRPAGSMRPPLLARSRTAGHSLNVFHDDTRTFRIVERGIVEGDGVGMREARHQECFAGEAIAEARIGRDVVVHDLDHNLPVQTGIARQVNTLILFAQQAQWVSYRPMKTRPVMELYPQDKGLCGQSLLLKCRSYFCAVPDSGRGFLARVPGELPFASFGENPALFALLPACGQSRRMGRPKLTLPLGDRTVLEWVVAALRQAGIEHILVVSGPHTPGLAELAESAGAEVCRLNEPTPDMRQTIEQGLSWLEKKYQPGEEDFWLLVPPDHPTLEGRVIDQLLQRSRKQPQRLDGRPHFCGQARGHPTLIGWQHVAGIRRGIQRSRG